MPPKPVPASGTRTAYAFIPNGIYDFNFGPSRQMRRWWAWEFGYRVIAGIRCNINPSLELDVDYRYLATTNSTFVFNGGGAPVPVIGTTCSSGYATYSVVVSLTERFGGAAR